MPAKSLSVILLLGVILFQSLSGDLRAENRNHPAGGKANSETLPASFEKTIAGEEASIEELKTQMGRLEIIEKALLIELNAYKIQYSMHGNLLLLPQTKVEDLEKAFSDHKITLSKIADRLKDFQQKKSAALDLLHQTEEQLNLNKKQLSEIKAERLRPSEKEALAAGLNDLIRLQDQKRNLLKNISEIQDTILTRFEESITSFSRLSEKLEQQVKARRKQTLFERKNLPLGRETGRILRSDLTYLNETLRQIFRMDFWTKEVQKAHETGVGSLVTFFILFLIAIGFANRFRHYWVYQEQQLSDQHFIWGVITIRLFQRSITILGAALFLYLYNCIQFPHYKVPLIHVIVNLLLTIIFCRWALDFLKYIRKRELLPVTASSIKRIAMLVRTLRIFAVFYIFFAWVVGSGSIVLFFGRVLLEVGLIAWCIVFWRNFNSEPALATGGKAWPLSTRQTIIAGMSYIVVFGGIVIEVAGYSALTLYWYVSWARSIAVIFWAVLVLLALKEWQRSQQQTGESEESEAEGPKVPPDPFRWLINRFCWVAWIILVVIAIIQAWSTQQIVLARFYGVMKQPFAIGKINLSLLGLAYASLVLFLIYVATYIGRYVLVNKIFARSTLERGLQDSITTITVYVVWGLGIVLALSVLGVSATSVAVVFGALSIGIGFGLQNIFNNFISGIILLFERPIQVGDAVEVSGIWGEVKKINVRSTVVQTFDNASLIIPNSEFISSQVTNWSFKDQTLRRKINIGVAYGSDVERVRQTLFEIARNTKNVLKTPKPDVLFMDHGDSALIFTMRYWTTVDYYYTTETDIRFAIDHLFRERNIEIAFPQRDIHIRSVVKDSGLFSGAQKPKLNPSE